MLCFMQALLYYLYSLFVMLFGIYIDEIWISWTFQEKNIIHQNFMNL